jgi:biopolymer transport protein TolQ
MSAFGSMIPLAGIMSAFWLSNFAGQIIVVVLYLGSILVWAVMLTKMNELRRAQAATRNFVAAFRRENHPVNIYLKRQRFDPSPLYLIYGHACKTLAGMFTSQAADPNDLFHGNTDGPGQALSDLDLRTVRTVGERVMADQAHLLDRQMGYLVLATTTAPFLGLLGTVWGVMDSFENMYGKGSATLAAVAPGVAGALLTTVVGLLVALPSAIGYNIMSDQIRRLCVEMENFLEEFLNRVERQYLRQK